MTLLPEGNWNSRGYLPHFDSPHLVQHVTFHLADSLPREVLIRFEEEVKALPLGTQEAAKRERIHAWIDAGHGSCLLGRPAIARTVEEALLFFDGQRYRLFAWAVMPNHVHALMQTMGEWDLFKIVASWKKYTGSFIRAYLNDQRENAYQDNASLKQQAIWHREFWDRFIRNEQHFYRAVLYIHGNPVEAGLVSRETDWPWSSARFTE